MTIYGLKFEKKLKNGIVVRFHVEKIGISVFILRRAVDSVSIMKSNLLSKIVNYFQLGNPKSEQKDAKKTSCGENEREPISTESKPEEQYECGEDIYTRRYSKDRKRIQMFVLNPRVFVFLNEYKGKAEKKKTKTGQKQNQAEFKDKEPSLHDEEIEIETRLLKFAKKATSVLVKVSKVIQLVFPWFEVVVGNLEVVLAHDADMWNLGKGVVLSVLFMRVRDSSSKESIKNQQLLRELTENIAKKAQEGIFKDFVVDGTSQDTETDRPVGGIGNPKGNLSSGDSNARVESCVGEDQNFSKDTDAVKIKKDVESKGTHSELTLSIEGISLYTLTDKGKIKVRDHALKHEGFAGNLFHYLSREIGVISNEDKCVVLHTMDQTRLGINLLCSNHWWIKEVVSAVVFKSIRIYGDGIEKLLLEFGHCFVDNISTELNSKALRELLTSMNNEFLKEKDLDATNNRDFDKKNDVSFDLSSRGTENESLSKEDLSSEIFKLNKKNVYLCKIGKLLKRLELSNFCIQFIINEFSLITRERTERNLKKEASYEDVLNLIQRDISCSFSYKKLKEVITVKTEADGITVAPGSKGSTPANESKSKTLPKKCSTNDRSKSTIYTHHGGSGSTFTPAIKCLSEYEKDLKIGVQLDFFIETGPLTIYVMGQGEVSSENGTSGSPRLQNGFVNSGCKVGITLPIRIDTSSNEQLTSKPVISARIGDSSLAVDVHFVSACLNALNMCKGYLALLKNEMEFVSKMSHANLRNRFSYLYQNLYDEDVLAALASTTTQIPTNTTTTKESAIEKGQKERSYKKEAQRWITIKWAISSFFKKINLNVDVNKISAELTPTFTTLQLKDKELKPNFVKIVIPKAYSNAVFYLVNEGSNIKNISCLSFEGRVSGELSPVQISLNGKDCVDVKSDPAHINSRVIVGNNGIQYNGSINGKLGCNSFNSQLFKSAIESDFKINIGVLVASIFANELRFIMKWLPLWINGMNIVSKGNANGTMFNSTSRTSLSYEKAKGLNGRNSRANTASYSFFNDNKDIDIKGAEKTTRGMDFTLKIDTVLDEVRASVSASDCENPVIDQVEHGVNVCLRKANLVFRKEKKKLQSNTNLKVGFSQFLMNTFACTPRMNKNGGGEFSDFTEFAAKDVHFPEQILFLTQFSGSVSWKVKNNTKNDSTKRVGNFEADTFQIRISTVSLYRLMLVMTHIGISGRLSRFSERFFGKAEKKNTKEKLSKMKMSFKFNEFVLVCEFSQPKSHESSTRKLINSRKSGSNMFLRLSAPNVLMNICVDKSRPNVATRISLKAPCVGILGTDGEVSPLFMLSNPILNLIFPSAMYKMNKQKKLGIRPNKTDTIIELRFDEGSINVGHRYYMSSTIDSLKLLQKSFKQLFSKYKLCLQTVSSAMDDIKIDLEGFFYSEKCFIKLMNGLTAISNIGIPEYRGKSSAAKLVLKSLREPDDLPTFKINGKLLSLIIQDDPFETAIQRIMRVGRIEQAGRQSRIQAFQKKMANSVTLNKNMTSFESAHSTVDPKAGGGANDVSSGTEHRRARVRTEFRNSVSGLSSFKHQEVHHLHGDPKSKKKSATDYKNKVFGESSSFSQIGGYGGRDSLKLNRVDFKKSITDIHMTPLRPQSTSIPEGKDKLSGENTSSNNNSQEENLLYSAMQKLLEYESSSWINAIRNYMIKPNPRNTDDHSRNSSFSCFSGVSTHWSNPRLSKFKGSYKFPADKCFDLKEHSYNNNEACSDTELPMDNYEIINEVSYPDLPAFYDRQLYRITEIETIKMSLYESQEKEPEKPPYKYHEIDWKHPVVPMCVISLRAFCIELETPTELLSFEQIEQYLRSIDPEVPPNQLWSTLIPLRMKLKTGEIKVQMRDISIPLFLIPDPFFSEDQAEIENRQKQSYRNFRCGLKVEGCFIFSEQRALEKSLRLSSFTVDKIPAPHLSTETLNDLSSVGEYSDTEKTVLLPWFVSKSFMFPRIHSRLSFIIYTAATDKSAAANDIIRSGNLDGHSQSEFTRELLTSLINLRRFPTSSPIVCWGQRVQPTIVSFSQRFESLSSSSGEPSPHIGWWDKLRSRAKIQLRALLVDVDLDELATSDSFRLSNEYKIGRRGRNRPVEHTSELLFYTPGGRDPHNYAVENRGYLFSFRGGVRLSIGEGDLETSGVCKIFKKNIVINQGNGSRSEVGIAAKMSENIRIKCRTFLCGVPGIEEEMRNAELVLKSAVMYNPGYKHRDYSLKADQEMFQNLRHQMLAASKIFIGRFGRLSSNNYMFLKVLGELNSGVRISLGTSFEIQERIHLNTFIGKDECQNSQSLENGTENEYKSYISKWEILPHAPENIPSALKDVYDAYSGFRSSGIDLGISILSPFEAESAPSTNPAVVPTSTHTEAPQEVREFERNDSEHIGVNTSEIKNDWIHDFSNFTTTSQSKGIKTLASADNEIQPSPVLPYDDENESYRGYSAERHIPQRSAKTATKMASVGPSFGGRAKRSGSRDGPGDPDYTKRNMAPNPRDSHVYDATVGDDREETDSEYFMSMDSKDRDIFTPGPIKTFAFLQSTRSITKPRSRWHDRRIFLLSPLHKCEFGDHMGTQDMYFGAFVKRSDMSNAFKDERSVNISLITSKHFMSYLSLFASRLNLPVKKGRMYPERSTKDIKFGKVLRSVRLGIDFRDFELCHSLQISQVKEMGLKEFDELKIFTNPQLKLSELLKNMTNLDEMTNSRFSDISSPYEIKASKVEGDIFQVKARAKFLQASLLAVQKRVKTVLNTKSSSSSLSSIIGEKASKKKIIFQWGIPRIDADVDNIDVRLIKMSYRLPVFVNSDNGLEADSKSDYWGGNIVNGIRLTKSAESMFIEKPHLASWINLKSLQDPTHFNLNHATFYDANVLCFLTAPRLVYFIKDEVESLAKKTAERLDAQYASLNLASNDVESHQGKMRMNSASLAEVGTDLDRSTNIKKFTSSHSLSKGYLLNNTSKDKEETIPTNSLKNSVMKQKNTSRTESSLDHRKILRDSRLTQAILLCRRKERLGMAIEMNELRQRKLMEAFEFGADIEYEESTTQNALEIYDLCFRRRLINRCMSLLGISPEKITSENLVDQINDSLSSSTPGMTQAKEARELESKYRHRFLLYSAYLIWTSQIRDISMKLFYNEDTWLAMEYFISQTAAKVVSDLSNRNASEEGIKAETLSSSKPGKNTVQKSRDLANRHARRFQSDSSFQKPSELSEPVQSSENTGADFVTDSNTKNIDSSIFADNIDKFVPIYNALIEFLNSQLSFRIDESSVDAVVASVEKAQLHMIKLYSDEILGRSASSLETTITRDPTPSIDMGGSVSVFEELDKDDNDNSKTFAIGKDSRREAPNIYRLTGFSSSRNKTNNRMIDTTVEVNYEEHLVKTRMLAELTNMQMFSVKKEDFVKCPIYLIDCSYGSDVADLTNTTGTLWPAWVPIEILLTPEFTQTELIKNSASKDDKTHKASILAEGRRLLKQYSRFLDRSSAIILYDRVNPHRIKDVDTAEHEDEDILDQQSEKATAESSDAAELDCVQSEALESINSNLDKVDDSAPLPSSKSSKKSLKSGKSNSTNKRSPAPLPNTGSSAAGNSNRGKATYVGVYMSHINVASTSAQYRLLFDMISQLFVYNEPGKVEYLDELNSIILSTDLASIYNAGPTVVRLQDQLRVRKRLIEEWVQKQWEDSLQHSSFNDNSVVIANGKANQLHTVAQLSLESFQHVISNLDKARSVLILSRQINVLEHQLRITMDLVSAAQKKISMLARSSTRHLSGLTPGSNSSSQIIRPDSQISDRNELANELASYTLSEQNKPPMLSKTQANSRANTFTSGNDTSLPADYDESIDDIPGDQNKEYGTKKSKYDWSFWKSLSRRKSQDRLRRADTASDGNRLFNHRSISDDHLGTKSTRSHQDPLPTPPKSIARYITANFSYVNWRMLDDDSNSICDLKLRNLGAVIETTTSQSNDIVFEIDLVVALSRVPDSKFPEMIMPFAANMKEPIDFSKNKMLRVVYSQLAPVGGINIVENLEIDMSPIRIQLSYDIGSMMIEYFFPKHEAKYTNTAKSQQTSTKNTAESKSTGTGASTLDSSATSITKGRPGSIPLGKKGVSDFDETRSIKSSTTGVDGVSQAPSRSANLENHDQQQQQQQSKTSALQKQKNENLSMKDRASSNYTFIHVKMQGHPHIITYRGPKRKNITDLTDFQFNSPTIELRNEVLSYYELLMKLKKAFIGAAVQHTGALFREKVKQLRGAYPSKNEKDALFNKRLVEQINEDEDRARRSAYYPGNADTMSINEEPGTSSLTQERPLRPTIERQPSAADSFIFLSSPTHQFTRLITPPAFRGYQGDTEKKQKTSSTDVSLSASRSTTHNFLYDEHKETDPLPKESAPGLLPTKRTRSGLLFKDFDLYNINDSSKLSPSSPPVLHPSKGTTDKIYSLQDSVFLSNRPGLISRSLLPKNIPGFRLKNKNGEKMQNSPSGSVSLETEPSESLSMKPGPNIN